MDFSGRGVRPFQQGSSNTPAQNAPLQQTGGSKKKPNKDSDNKGVRIAISIVGLLLLILAVATITLLAFSRVEKEADFVDPSKTQAVFWDNSQSMQAYFGDIVSITKDYVVLRNVFYIQSTEGGENADDTQLIKLGCELHKPNDEMVINRDKVMFWENIQDDGRVAQAIADFNKNNPDGQTCAANSNNSNVQGSSTTDTATPSAQTPAANSSQQKQSTDNE